MLATQLSKLKLNVRIVDKAAHPVLRGHADGMHNIVLHLCLARLINRVHNHIGLQCRTCEVFHALDVGTRFEEEACECAGMSSSDSRYDVPATLV